MNAGRGTSPSAPPEPFPVCSTNPKSHCSACISARGLTDLSGGAAHDQELVASLPARCSRMMGGTQGSCCRDSTKAGQATRQRHSLHRGTSLVTLAVPQLKNLCSKNMKSSRKHEWDSSIKHSDWKFHGKGWNAIAQAAGVTVFLHRIWICSLRSPAF